MTRSPKKVRLEYTYVDSQQALEEICLRLQKAEILAVDTEFVGEKYYYPRLEVIQVSDGKEICLIDAPLIENLEALARLLGDPEKEKIFHAGDQDLAILNRELGVMPLPAFDCQVAGALLGYGSQISLVNLTRRLLQVSLGGKQTTSDWSHRPLSEEQLDYAARDVLHLHELREKLRDDLQKRGRLSWYEEEQESHIVSAKDEDAPTDEERWRKVKDWASLDPRELAILRELAAWREQTARQENKPRRQIFTDEGLVEIARHQPKDRAKMKKLRRLNVGQAFRFFDEVMKCLEKGKSVPKEDWPRKTVREYTTPPIGVVELCQALLRIRADQQDVAPTLLAKTADLQYLVNNRDRIGELELPLLQGWRREICGGEIADLLEGKVSLRIDKEGNLLVEG